MSELHPIGAVVEELRGEFPDLTVSKVRYLEAAGLVIPQRTARGSRRYAPMDVHLLRRILRLQRDEYLPLAVIRQRLTEPEPAAETDRRAIPVTRMRRPRSRRMSAAEVAERSGIDAATLRELTEHGLVVDLDSSAVDICQLVARLRGYGIEPRHLRSFRVAADREVGLVEQALAPHLGASASPEARERMAELLTLLLDFHVALVRQRSSSLES